MNTYYPMYASKISYQERKYDLDSMLFSTEERNGDVKVRKVAIGSKQLTYDGYDNSKGSSHTVNNDSVFLTGVLYAHELRAIAMLDIQNAFLYAENNEYVCMLLSGKLAELLVKVNPSFYRKYVITSKQGVTMLYFKLTKALYVMLRSAMLFYKKLRGRLDGTGFEVNPYLCVANKVVNGSQMTVCWHVDDMRISHIEEDSILAPVHVHTQLLMYRTPSYSGPVAKYPTYPC